MISETLHGEGEDEMQVGIRIAEQEMYTYKKVWIIVKAAIFQNADASNDESHEGNSSRLTALRITGRKPELKIVKSSGDTSESKVWIHGFDSNV